MRKIKSKNKPKKARKPRIIAVVGPTASGKSGLAIGLARKFNGEVISADSRQVYHGMDIGTGKVEMERNFISEGIRHHLIDVASPKKQFTADDFKRLGEKAVEEILAAGKTVIIAGGTGFYIDILLGRAKAAKVEPNPVLRKKLEKLSTEELYSRLKKLDPRRAKNIDTKNRRRLIRALEIVISTGKPVPRPKMSEKYEILWLGLNPKDLKEKISKRLDERLAQGMVKEAEKLIKSGVSKKRLREFGLEYRWLADYISGKVDFEQMKTGLLRDIIRFSKRQMTWFKRNKAIRWIDNPREAEKLVGRFLAL